jgi:hypothetical protein
MVNERGRSWRWRRRAGIAAENPEPVPVTDALAAVGAELGLADPGALAVLSERWRDVVGDAVAPHARLQSLRGGVLTIAVDAAPWATELRYLESTLRERVAHVTGLDLVRAVRVVVEPRV